MDFYKQQIVSDVELLCEKWRTKAAGVSNSVISQSFSSGVSEMLYVEGVGLQGDTSHIAEESCMAEQLLQCSGSQQEFAEQDPLFEEQWDCLEE